MKIQKTIPPNSLGILRRVTWEGIERLSFKNKYAQIFWNVEMVDENGNLLEEPDLNQERQVMSILSNENRVNENGLLVIPEYYDTEEEYQAALLVSIPEFDFWVGAIHQVTLPQLITGAIDMLVSTGRFDRV